MKISKDLNQISRLLESVTEDEGKVAAKVAMIKRFREEFDDIMEKANIEDKEFDDLFDKSEPIMNRIDQILPHLNAYQLATLSFP